MTTNTELSDEQAPANGLPTWEECAIRVSNSDFIAKRVAEGGYGPEPDSLLASQLHRFIYEYDDMDPYRSAWFMHRLELLLNETRAQALSAVSRSEVGEPAPVGEPVNLHPNHLPDLRYALMVLEKVRDLVLPTFPEQDAAHGEIAASINGMRYIIKRTEEAERELRGPQEGKEVEWLPIETAPKDGTHVQLFRPEIQFVGYFAVKAGRWCINAPGLPVMDPEPTNWKPLPAPPSATLKESTEGEQKE